MIMTKAIVTGASSGIGLKITKMLLEHGYEVYGIGRKFVDEINHPLFHKIVCNLLDEDALKKCIEMIPTKEITLLVNNAGCAYYGMHETIKKDQIKEMVRLNLEIPMILTQQYIRSLRDNKGTIINIASISGTHAAPHGASYAATKAGLISFSRSLFEENRKHGMKVTCIIPDMTDTNLYRNADFEADKDFGCCIEPEDIAMIIEEIIEKKDGIVVTEITVQPQYHRIKKKIKEQKF